MIHEGLPVSVVFVDLFITGTETTTTSTVYERASTPTSTKSLHQVIECVSLTHARTHNQMLLSLQFFLLFFCWVLNKSVSALKIQKSSSVVVGGKRTPATGRRYRCLMQIHRRPADALPCARVTASRGSDHATLSFARLDGDRSALLIKCRFFFQMNKLRPSPYQTSIVRLKQNVDKWRQSLRWL